MIAFRAEKTDSKKKTMIGKIVAEGYREVGLCAWIECETEGVEGLKCSAVGDFRHLVDENHWTKEENDWKLEGRSFTPTGPRGLKIKDASDILKEKAWLKSNSLFNTN